MLVSGVGRTRAWALVSVGAGQVWGCVLVSMGTGHIWAGGVLVVAALGYVWDVVLVAEAIRKVWDGALRGCASAGTWLYFPDGGGSGDPALVALEVIYLDFAVSTIMWLLTRQGPLTVEVTGPGWHLGSGLPRHRRLLAWACGGRVVAVVGAQGGPPRGGGSEMSQGVQGSGLAGAEPWGSLLPGQG